MDNLLVAWREFLCGKRRRKDVEKFSMNLSDNIIALHFELKNKTYRHGTYHAFKIRDSKPRDIHKATVRDRLLHHAIYRALYPFFDRKFIDDSYSCRVGKGTHRAINRFREFGRIVSKNNRKTCWVLKGDIRKFFASIDHEILKRVLRRHIKDNDVNWLLGQIISSFETVIANESEAIFCGRGKIAMPLQARDDRKRGLPLGNLTSQLLVNIYMNEFDQFVKRELKCRFYIRYADDFVILHESRSFLENLIPKLELFLAEKLKLSLHPDKLFIKTLASGVDFLGWINFPRCRILRTVTKKRMIKKIKASLRNETIQSYLGLIKHGNTAKLRNKLQI